MHEFTLQRPPSTWVRCPKAAISTRKKPVRGPLRGTCAVMSGGGPGAHSQRRRNRPKHPREFVWGDIQACHIRIVREFTSSSASLMVYSEPKKERQQRREWYSGSGRATFSTGLCNCTFLSGIRWGTCSRARCDWSAACTDSSSHALVTNRVVIGAKEMLCGKRPSFWCRYIPGEG